MKAVKAALFMLFVPPALMALWSVSLRWPMPGLLPSVWTLRWWKMMFSPASKLFQALATGAAIALAAAFCTVLAGLPASRALARERPARRRALRVFFLLPLIVPPVGYIFGSYKIFLRLGLTDCFAGVVIAHMVPCLPYAVLFLSDGWTARVFELEEQARVLGAGTLAAFWRVGLPAAAPVAAAAFGFCFVVSMGQYLTTLLVGGGRFVTAATLLVPLVKDGERGPAAALSLSFTALCALCAGLARRWGRRA